MNKSLESLFVVTVALVPGGARADLLAMASVLHRRGIDVIEAELSRPGHDRRVFSATFRSTERQAATVLKSLEGLVDVVDATLYAALDVRGVAVVDPSTELVAER